MRKSKDSGGFSLPMTGTERVLGWIYLLLHVFVMTYVVNLIDLTLESRGTQLSDAYLNLLYYGIGFVFVLVAMFRFLKASFSDLIDNLWTTVKCLLYSFLLYYVLSVTLSWLLSFVLTGLEYHLWEYFIASFSWSLLLYLLEYLPAGFVLAWCYEKSKNLWACIFLHMMMNYISITITLG